MILYHGTNAEFDDIDLAKLKPNKGIPSCCPQTWQTFNFL